MSCHLTTEEAHQIAYLTMHGWTLVGEEWQKKGFEHEYEKSHGCGCCTYNETTPYFSLENAYYAQLASNDAETLPDHP